MSRLLDRTTLSTLSGNSAYLDMTQYTDARLSAVFDTVDSLVSKYLHYTPYSALHTAEEGIAQYLEAGDFAGRYLLTMQHRPLVPGTPAQIFTDLELRYALTSTSPSAVDLSYAQVDHATARVYALAPGGIDALAGVGVGFQVGATRGLRATSYLASYWAGWATSIGDPTPPAGVTPDPLPTDIQMASALLAQEFLSYQASQAQATGLTTGTVIRRRRVGEREEEYAVPAAAASGQAALGFGSPLSVTAASLLAPYKKYPSPMLA